MGVQTAFDKENLKETFQDIKNTMIGREAQIPNEPLGLLQDVGDELGIDKADDEDITDYKEKRDVFSGRPGFRTIIMVLEVLIWPTLLMLPCLILNSFFDHAKYNVIKFKVGQAGFTPNPFREFFRWSVFCAASFASYSFSIWIVGMLNPLVLGAARLFKFSVGLELRQTLKTFKQVRKYVSLFIWLCFEIFLGGLVLFQKTFFLTPDLETQFNKANTEKALFAAALTFGLLALEKYFIQTLIHAFHKESLSLRIERNNYLRQIIGKLFRSIKHMEGSDKFELKTEFTDAGLHEIQKDPYLAYKNPKVIATNIFKALKQPDREYIRPEDFRPYLSTSQEAKEAFRVLDTEICGKIDLEYFKTTITNIYAEQDRILDAVQQNGRVIKRFDATLTTIIVIFSIIVVVGLFSEKGYAVLLSLFTILITFTFLIKDTMGRVYDAIRLIYIERAFDVGDTIKFGGASYSVVAIRLLTTHMIRLTDNTLTYVPNHSLADKFIFNTKRIPFTVDKAILTVYGNIEMHVIGALKSEIDAFTKNSFPEYIGVCSIRIKDLSSGKAILTVSLNFTTATDEKVLDRRNKFRQKILELVEQISASEPVF